MKKADVLRIGKISNFVFNKELQDLTGTRFLVLHYASTDTIAIFRDQKDNDFFLLGLYNSEAANKFLNKILKWSQPL